MSNYPEETLSLSDLDSKNAQRNIRLARFVASLPPTLKKTGQEIWEMRIEDAAALLNYYAIIPTVVLDKPLIMVLDPSEFLQIDLGSYSTIYLIDQIELPQQFRPERETLLEI